MKFRIPIPADNKEKILEVILKLIVRGYVFTSGRRYREPEQISDWFNDFGWYYDWILIGYDRECKMTLVVCTSDYNGIYDYQQTNIEMFLQIVDNQTKT